MDTPAPHTEEGGGRIVNGGRRKKGGGLHAIFGGLHSWASHVERDRQDQDSKPANRQTRFLAQTANCCSIGKCVSTLKWDVFSGVPRDTLAAHNISPGHAFNFGMKYWQNEQLLLLLLVEETPLLHCRMRRIEHSHVSVFIPLGKSACGLYRRQHCRRSWCMALYLL